MNPEKNRRPVVSRPVAFVFSGLAFFLAAFCFSGCSHSRTENGVKIEKSRFPNPFGFQDNPSPAPTAHSETEFSD